MTLDPQNTMTDEVNPPYLFDLYRLVLARMVELENKIVQLQHQIDVLNWRIDNPGEDYYD
jgi:hypothetical protein